MSHPVIVAGGGLAVSAATCALPRAGVPVLLIERETQPADKIWGEFISAAAQDYLRDLGLDIAALGGVAIAGLRLMRDEKVVSYASPFAGIGLSRSVLDEAMAASRRRLPRRDTAWADSEPETGTRAHRADFVGQRGHANRHAFPGDR